jgi:hypothetical protein
MGLFYQLDQTCQVTAPIHLTMERSLNRLPCEIWLIISRHLSLGDLSALHLALSEGEHARIREPLCFRAAEALYSLLLRSPLRVTLKIDGEPYPPKEPSDSFKPSTRRRAHGKQKAASLRSLTEYQPFVESAAFGFRQLTKTSTTGDLPNLVISFRRVGSRTISCPRLPFITPRHGKQPLEPTTLQLVFSSSGMPADPGILVLDYAKGDGSLSVTSDGEYRLRGPGVLFNYYDRSVFQNLEIQSAIWRTENRDVELPRVWILDIARVFVRVSFSKKMPLSRRSEDSMGAEWHTPGNVEFVFRNISIPPTLDLKGIKQIPPLERWVV